jgi:hypothetical protein
LILQESARSFDRVYKLAEQCARSSNCAVPKPGSDVVACVLQNLHRFKESETLARRLVSGADQL